MSDDGLDDLERRLARLGRDRAEREEDELRARLARLGGRPPAAAGDRPELVLPPRERDDEELLDEIMDLARLDAGHGAPPDAGGVASAGAAGGGGDAGARDSEVDRMLAEAAQRVAARSSVPPSAAGGAGGAGPGEDELVEAALADAQEPDSEDGVDDLIADVLSGRLS